MFLMWRYIACHFSMYVPLMNTQSIVQQSAARRQGSR